MYQNKCIYTARDRYLTKKHLEYLFDDFKIKISKINLNIKNKAYFRTAGKKRDFISWLQSNTSTCSLFFFFHSLCFQEYFTKFSGHQLPKGLVKTQVFQPYPRDSDSVGPGYGLRICISSKFSGNGDVADGRLYFENQNLGASLGVSFAHQSSQSIKLSVIIS